MFHTPNDKSYQCADVGKISLSSSMQWNYTKMASHDVANTTANALQVRFDAFRNIGNSIPDQFRVNFYYLKSCLMLIIDIFNLPILILLEFGMIIRLF